MTSQDIVSQLRDLQSVIDDFSEMTREVSKSEIFSNVDDNSQPDNYQRHTLMDAMLQFQVSEDFAELMDTINDIDVSIKDIDIKACKNTFESEATRHDDDNEDEELPQFATKKNAPNLKIMISNNSRPLPLTTLSLSDHSVQTNEGRTVSPCTGSPKRKLPSPVCKYYARSYEEMMRIPGIDERIRFYEKTYQQCIQAPSTLYNWGAYTPKKTTGSAQEQSAGAKRNVSRSSAARLLGFERLSVTG
ncbi:hypothetical protein DM01DRAFT_324446 [Hesseltinella vesiculosa]|uniref:Uncharacterized protein n=1 Tax=Hesseltinella vesiculosa TaxID=101127 RepID=A0A1X2G2C7_9FUNG|nr:hypothetical protein DM01DRAFT_324446 [Hesseltinella vesiculosa]